MTTFRRILLTTSLAAAASGLASANSIDFLSTPTTSGPTATDFSYSLSLPEFNLSGFTLTGATIYFFAEETVSSLTFTNNVVIPETFTPSVTDNVTSSAGNTANSADAFGAETLSLFDQSITLGPKGAPTCPAGTPSASCSSVTYTTLPKVDNLGLGLTTGTGGVGLTGVVESISGADLVNYIGSGNFNLTGSTLTTLSGLGGGNVVGFIDGTVQVSAEVDYTYTVAATPEPTMGLIAGALAGHELLGRRLKKN
jgi:hypothetical protein